MSKGRLPLAAALWLVSGLADLAAAPTDPVPTPRPTRSATTADPERSLRPAEWSDLAGFARSDHQPALEVLRAWCARRGMENVTVRPPAAAAVVRMDGVCASALTLAKEPSARQVREFFMTQFRPWRVDPRDIPGSVHAANSRDEKAFLTGYYEPEVDGSPVRTKDFRAAILARPDDLVSLTPDEKFYPDERSGVDAPLSAARRRRDGLLEPYPSRAAIQAGAADARPLVWLRDEVEVFLIQVQGSARVQLPDGSRVRLAYDGRNGHPYTSIGRILVEEGRMAKADMTLANLKRWLRANAAAGTAIMARNRSYVFFKMLPDPGPAQGPTGGAGLALTALRTIAVDRHIWPYGLPFWIDAQLPWRSRELEPFQRLMIALDTGSAILGPARADIFFGSGVAAGERAGDIRHPGRFFVLLPKDFTPS